jgi:NAD(P)-dependent dehydrogenase (short-subunit alcohol dehydrogenase family)
MQFQGKRAIVTGAASGIGRATALHLHNEGAEVWAADIAAEGLAETAELSGGSIKTHTYDASDVESCKALVAEVTKDGGLDILCNIAGMLAWGETHDFDEGLFAKILAVNLTGTFAMCRAALPHLIESKGSIVNMASTAGLGGTPYATAYAASKHGVVGLTKSIAVEYASKGVRVNAVAPGHVDTPMGNKAPPTGDIDWALMMRGAPKLLDGKCDPSDIAEMVAFLASDKARKITGTVINVDGGQLAG